jgi:hypothetical protein
MISYDAFCLRPLDRSDRYSADRWLSIYRSNWSNYFRISSRWVVCTYCFWVSFEKFTCSDVSGAMPFQWIQHLSLYSQRKYINVTIEVRICVSLFCWLEIIMFNLFIRHFTMFLDVVMLLAYLHLCRARCSRWNGSAAVAAHWWQCTLNHVTVHSDPSECTVTWFRVHSPCAAAAAEPFIQRFTCTAL